MLFHKDDYGYRAGTSGAVTGVYTRLYLLQPDVGDFL
jgi:hypothetical protein